MERHSRLHSFLLIQLVLTILTMRPGQPGTIGIKGLTFMGALYTVAQVGEPIVWRQMQPAGFDLAQVTVLLFALASSTAMFVFGIRAWREIRSPSSVPG